MKNLRFTLLLTLALVGFSNLANADVFFTDNFNYADGALTADDGGNNVSGGLWTRHSGSGDNVSVVSGQAQVLNTGNEDVNRAAGSTMVAGDTWYAAALFTVNDTRTAADPINNDYFLHVKDSGFGFRSRVYLDEPNVVGGDYTVGLSATSGGQTQKWASDLVFGSENLLVVSYDFDSGTSQLWINPTNMASTSLSDTNAGAIGTAINALALRQDFVGTGANNAVLINGASLGNDFEQVRTSFEAIPEPTSITLIAGLGLVAALRRRK